MNDTHNTLPISISLHAMVTTLTLNSRIMRQKSNTVFSTGPWLAM